MRGTATMNDELLKAIRQVVREELNKEREVTRATIREELDKEREVTRADMRDLRQEMHEGFARLDDRIDKFKLEMRFRLKHIAEVLTDHDKRLADHDGRLKTLEDEPGNNGDDDGNSNGRGE